MASTRWRISFKPAAGGLLWVLFSVCAGEMQVNAYMEVPVGCCGSGSFDGASGERAGCTPY